MPSELTVTLAVTIGNAHINTNVRVPLAADAFHPQRVELIEKTFAAAALQVARLLLHSEPEAASRDE
jgi:hypothetical protein